MVKVCLYIVLVLCKGTRSTGSAAGEFVHHIPHVFKRTEKYIILISKVWSSIDLLPVLTQYFSVTLHGRGLSSALVLDEGSGVVVGGSVVWIGMNAVVAGSFVVVVVMVVVGVVAGGVVAGGVVVVVLVVVVVVVGGTVVVARVVAMVVG